jgi:hypothetical protein
MNLETEQVSERDYSMLAIELKLCLVVATIADFKERQRADDVNQDEAKPASVPSHALPPGLTVSGNVLRRRPACLEVRRSG